MTEQELRALVRSVIADHARLAPGAMSSAPGAAPNPAAIPLVNVRNHASHGLFVIPPQGDACVIEPAVACNHCGYCKSYGH